MNKVTKIILIIAAVLCLVSGFLPWLDFGRDAKVGPESMAPVYIVPGVILLVLNALALFMKKKSISLVANILGILGGLGVLICTVMTLLGINMMYGTFEYVTIGAWTAVVSGVLLFVVSIVSMAKEKKANRE